MTRVAIVGGGIGGLTAACALCRRGIEVSIYEAAPERVRPRRGARALQRLARIASTHLLGQRGLVQVGALRPRSDPALHPGPCHGAGWCRAPG